MKEEDCFGVFTIVKDIILPIAIPLLVLFITIYMKDRESKNKRQKELNIIQEAFRKTLENLLNNILVEKSNLENLINNGTQNNFIQVTYGINSNIFSSFNSYDLNEVVFKNDINYSDFSKIHLMCDFINENSTEKLIQKYNTYIKNNPSINTIGISYFLKEQPKLTIQEIDLLKENIDEIIKRISKAS